MIPRTAVALMVVGPSGDDVVDHHPLDHHHDDVPNRQVMMLETVTPTASGINWRRSGHPIRPVKPDSITAIQG
jgi:hypothetical protein